MSSLLTNVHEGTAPTGVVFSSGNLYLVSGTYEYYHYLCDGFDDRGWGCGYRTLQTLCSWMNNNTQKNVEVPSIRTIQQILVDLEDKPRTFLGSRQWIGSFEVCLVIDKLYDVPCKILHVKKGDNLNTIVDTLKSHFEKLGSPIMMGGDVDCSSKGIMGIHVGNPGASLLVVYMGYFSERVKEIALLERDSNIENIPELCERGGTIRKGYCYVRGDPHFVGKEQTKEFLQNKAWVKWQPLEDFLSSSFYNLCLPQAKSKHR